MQTGTRLAALGYQQIIGAGMSFLTVPSGATLALMSVEGNAIRFRDDTQAPTAAVGFPLGVTGAGLPFEYAGSLAAFQFIPQTGSATLNVAYYKAVG